MVRLALFALLCSCVYAYHRAARTAPDPHAACAKETAQADEDSCRARIDFALSAGW